jgi:outer membrane protein assembly factor BamE (lipoprotein component of BamABCDE complex)
MIRFPPIPKAAACVLGLFAVLLTLEGCFFFRSKPDPKAQEITSRLSPGLTTDEVLELVGPPQRRGQNLFDKKKEYWIYEFVKQQKKSTQRSGDANRNGQQTVLDSEVQLLFERGKLVNWNVVPIKN